MESVDIGLSQVYEPLYDADGSFAPHAARYGHAAGSADLGPLGGCWKGDAGESLQVLHRPGGGARNFSVATSRHSKASVE